MDTVNINTSLVDNYFTLLKHLTPDHKLELISRLSESLKTAKKEEEEDVSLASLYGSFISEKSADEIVKELKEDRNFTRKEIEL